MPPTGWRGAAVPGTTGCEMRSMRLHPQRRIHDEQSAVHGFVRDTARAALVVNRQVYQQFVSEISATAQRAGQALTPGAAWELQVETPSADRKFRKTAHTKDWRLRSHATRCLHACSCNSSMAVEGDTAIPVAHRHFESTLILLETATECDTIPDQRLCSSKSGMKSDSGFANHTEAAGTSGIRSFIAVK